MNELLFYTTNPGKLAEAQQALTPLGITVIGRPFSFTEPQTDDQFVILASKFQQVKDLDPRPFLVDDAALYFRAYRGFPGTMTHYVYPMLGYEGLLRLLPPGVDRGAHYRGLLGFCQNGEMEVFEGISTGTILPEVSEVEARAGFPFDRIFCPEGETVAMAYLTPERRLTFSYRGRALAKLVAYLQENQEAAR